MPTRVPVLGAAIDFGTNPIKFLYGCYQTVRRAARTGTAARPTDRPSRCCRHRRRRHAQYGSVFRFKMFGRYCTYLIGSDAAALFFNSRVRCCPRRSADAVCTVNLTVRWARAAERGSERGGCVRESDGAGVWQGCCVRCAQ